MKILYAVCIIFFSSSCVTRLHYVGNSFPERRSVEVYVDPASIEKPYTVMGKGFVREGLGSVNYIRRIQPLAVAKAKQKGADAVLIQDFYTPAAATDLHTRLRTDGVGKGTVTVGNTTVQQSSEQKFTVLFLKYKE